MEYKLISVVDDKSYYVDQEEWDDKKLAFVTKKERVAVADYKLRLLTRFTTDDEHLLAYESDRGLTPAIHNKFINWSSLKDHSWHFETQEERSKASFEITHQLNKLKDKCAEYAKRRNMPPPVPTPPLPPEDLTPKISEEMWQSHALLVAGTRWGKTNILAHRISHLLPQIANGLATLILMEPKGVLTHDILRLQETWHLRDRLVIIDPADTLVSINLFDKGNGSPQAINAAVQRIGRIFSVLSAELSGFQHDALTFALRALFCLPPAACNIDTLLDILKRGIGNYSIPNLNERVAEYFARTFKPDTTGQQIVSRLSGLLANPIFEALFAGHDSTFDMLKEMQAGKLILICANARSLGGDVELFGRIWIEEVLRCMYPRLDMPANRRTPTTFILDEAQMYLREDQHAAAILDQAAEARISLFIAMQHMGQIDEQRVLDSIFTNTAVKLVAKTSAELTTLCANMGDTDKDFIKTLNKYEFAYHEPNLPRAVKVKFPRVPLDQRLRMSDGQYGELRRLNRERYGYAPRVEQKPEPLVELVPEPESTPDHPMDDTDAWSV